MTSLHGFLQLDPGRDFEAVFILEVTLRITALLLVAVITIALCRRASAATRHRLWMLAVVGAMILPFITLVAPGVDLTLPQTTAARENELPRAGSKLIAQEEESFLPPKNGSTRTDTGTLNGGFSSRNSPIEKTTSTNDAALDRVESTDPIFAKTRWMGASLLYMWGAGAIVAFFLNALSVTSANSFVRRATLVTDPSMLRLMRQLSGTIGVTKFVELRRCDQQISPMTWGVTHPVILLPVDCDNWSHDCRRAVLSHELAHIYRYDWVAQIIVHFAAIIYWYHPLIWLAKREVRKESDRAADDVALATGMSATKYAEQLLNVARGIAARWLHPAPAIVRRSQLARRISVLLDERRNRSKLNRRQSVIATVLTLCLVIPVSVVSVTTAEEAATSPFAREKLGDANKSLERERTAEEQELLEKQRGLLRVAVLETRKAYDLGTRSLDDYLRVVDRALAIELLLCKTPQESANVHAKNVQRAMDLENEIEAKNRIGARGGSQREYLAAKNARLKAEIGLEFERTEIESVTSSSDAKKLLALLCEYRRDVSQQNVDAAKREYLLGVIEADILVPAINDRIEAESLVSINPKERILVLQKCINDLSWLAQAVGEKLKIGARGGKEWLDAYCRATHAQAELLLLRSQMNADPQKTKKTSTAKIDQLLDQRDQGFEERVAAIRVEYQIGNAGVEEVLDGLADRLTSRLDREMTKQQRIQLCKQYLADTAKLENEVAVKAKIGARGGNQATLLFTRAERIGAEIELLRAKSQIID